jgi:acyl carrier protein
VLSTDAVLDLIRLAAAEEAAIPRDLIQLGSNATNVPGWDSLAHTRIIMNLEYRIGTELDMALTMQAANFGDLVKLVRDTLAQKN